MRRKKRKDTAVIAGYYGFGNAGDELILRSIVHQLRAQTPAIQITVLSSNPSRTLELLEVKAVSRWNPSAWIKPLWNAELFILGGGGLLQESTGPWNHLYYLLLLVLAKGLGCRTEARAIGVDPITHWWNRIWTCWVFNHMVNFISVRDGDSQRALETIGVMTRLWKTADPVFYLERPASRPAEAKPPRIAWAVAPWKDHIGWDHDLAFMLKRLTDQLGVANDLLVMYPEQDEALAHRVRDLAGGAPTVRVGSRPEDLLSWFYPYSLVIGMRYHALVLAALAEKPFIGWGFQRKVRTLCNDFSQPMWTFERGWDSDAVFRQIGDTWRRRDILPERYRSQMTQLLSAPVVASESARIFVPTV